MNCNYCCKFNIRCFTKRKQIEEIVRKRGERGTFYKHLSFFMQVDNNCFVSIFKK